MNVGAVQDCVFNSKQKRNKMRKGTRLDTCTIPRERKTVMKIYRELGPTYFKRSYRMSYREFQKLYFTMKPYLTFTRTMNTNEKKSNPPNGYIHDSIALACALRFFAGGDPYDLQQVFGISHSSVFTCIDSVIESINLVPGFVIQYPSDHCQQRRIAEEFCEISHANFTSCAGCLDGFLFWTHQPTLTAPTHAPSTSQTRSQQPQPPPPQPTQPTHPAPPEPSDANPM